VYENKGNSDKMTPKMSPICHEMNDILHN
jgi:hypothetical protein